MTKDTPDLRSFKGGAWDLRKDDRRKEQLVIAFPDRRRANRRNTQGEEAHSSSTGLLNWVNRVAMDE